MGSADLNLLLAEVSPDNPCGDDLEYYPEFQEIQRSAVGKAEQTLGSSTIPAEPPDWKRVRSGAMALLSRSKDLRIAILLARALLNTDGIRSLGDSLELISELLSRYWENLHPQLDEDDNDPTIRMNTIIALCDRGGMLSDVSAAPLVRMKGFGDFSLRDLKIARGELSKNSLAEGDAPDLASVNAAFMNCPIDELKDISDSLGKAVQSITSIDSIITTRVGSGLAPDLNPIVTVIAEASKIVDEYLANRGEVVVQGEEAIKDTSSPETTASGLIPASTSNLDIRSREDAVKMMDKISAYYQKHEPSSPIPLFMQRAKKLATLGFMEILKDIAPDGLKQAQTIGGVGEIKAD